MVRHRIFNATHVVCVCACTVYTVKSLFSRTFSSPYLPSVDFPSTPNYFLCYQTAFLLPNCFSVLYTFLFYLVADLNFKPSDKQSPALWTTILFVHFALTICTPSTPKSSVHIPSTFYISCNACQRSNPKQVDCGYFSNSVID